MHNFSLDDLSKGKYAQQSTTWSCAPSSNCAAGNAVDRTSSTCMRTGFIGPTSLDKTVWWFVDLGDIYSIYSVRILFKDYGSVYGTFTLTLAKYGSLFLNSQQTICIGPVFKHLCGYIFIGSCILDWFTYFQFSTYLFCTFISTIRRFDDFFEDKLFSIRRNLICRKINVRLKK